MKYNSKLLVILSILSMFFFSCEEIPINPGGGEGCEEIHGNWVRVRSNNPANDGMELIATGTEGTVIVARGSFDIGAIKWKDISGSGTNFTHQELGSDGLYYDASMELVSDTINISVNSSGSGNIQKWVRKESYTDPGPSGSSLTLDCSITEPMTLRNGSSAVDYVVPTNCVVDVTAALTIEPGTVIQMGENSGFGVYDNGSFNLLGTASEPIIIKGSTANRGWWRGIHIETDFSSNQMEYVQISDAGANYVYCCNTVASVFLKGASISMKNTRITNGDGIGLYTTNEAELREFESNTISNHNEFPLSMTIIEAQQLDGTASDFSGNDKDFAFLRKASVNEDSRLKKLNIPYEMETGVTDVTENLTLEAGVEIYMNENSGIGVFDNGSLTIDGTNDDPVILKGKSNVRGFWRGIHIETNTLGNNINYLNMSNAGSNYVYCCNTIASIFLKDGQTTIKNSSITDGAGYGIATKKNFSFREYENNSISTHDLEPLYLTIDQAGELDGTGSSYTGNDEDYILLYRAGTTASVDLLKTDVPYSVETNVVIDITKPLSLAAGVDIAFGSSAGLGIYDEGVLNAEGSVTEYIKFRGRTDQKGYWRGIHSETNSNSNILDYVEIRNAGINYVYCCNGPAGLLVKGGQMTVSNSFIADNDGCGIRISSGGTLTETNNTFSNNTDGHICN
ncbi:MAG: hypothetical protein AAFR87_24725 [Bacteroidota bacterium]